MSTDVRWVPIANLRGPAGLDSTVPGPPGVGSTGGSYAQNFASAQSIWDVNHGLNSTSLVVSTYDLNGEEIEAGVLILDPNTVRVSYDFPASGSVVVQR